MGGRRDFKSRLVSEQKPAKRRKRREEDREITDLMGIHARLAETRKQGKASKAVWIGAALFLLAVPGFFLLGCLIAALSVSVWVKVLLTIPIAILGLAMSYTVSALLR